MARRERRGEERREAGDELINSAVQEGIEDIKKEHPRFDTPYLLGHINPAELEAAVRRRRQHPYDDEKPWDDLSDDERREYLVKIVASGEAFDDAGKEIILKKSLEEKAHSGFFRGWVARKILKGEKYLDKVMGGFRELYHLLKSGDYAQRMPQLAKDITTIYEMGFFKTAVEVLAQYGLMPKRMYERLKAGINRKTHKAAERAVVGIEEYATAQKVAASVIAVFGVGVLILSGTNITGNAIGSSFNNTSGVISGVLLLISAFLISRKRHR